MRRQFSFFFAMLLTVWGAFPFAMSFWAFASTPEEKTEATSRLDPIPPSEPEEALRRLEIVPGYAVELAAAEPLVVDPVAATFDEDGRLYVAEMIDYPFKPKEGEPPLSRIRLLEDTDGDGRFDQSEIYADEILWPAGIACWRGGIFVAAAPHLWYFKDTDGDNRADVRRIVFTGFGTQNQQAMVNNLQWSMDHWIYGSAAGNGGVIQREGADPGASVSIEGTDFRFDPQTLQFEPITGRAQFGNTFDDWNNRFLCSESVPTYQEVLPRRYLLRNPDLPIPEAMKRLVSGVTPIYRTSPIEEWRRIRTERRMLAQERSAASAGASHHVLDGAAGATIYRGSALPEIRGLFFVGDAQNNLVHRRKLIPDGILFQSKRIDQETEFLRSSDNWFRPVNFVNAPDGSLLVLDMAREIIESIHIPTDVFEKLDLTRGRDRGRIYRIVPAKWNRPLVPKLSEASTTELVALLADDNAWSRDTASRLLFERQDKAARAPLITLFADSPNPLARLAALFCLQGMDLLTPEILTDALADPAPEVRSHAVRLAEPFLSEDLIRQKVISSAEDPDRRVRFQVAFTLGMIDRKASGSAVSHALATILRKDADDPWVRTAALSSSAGEEASLLSELLREDAATGDAAKQLAFLIGRRGDVSAIESVLKVAVGAGQHFQPALLVGIGQGLKTRGKTYRDLSLSAEVQKSLRQQFERSRNELTNPTIPAEAGLLLELVRYDSFAANQQCFESLLSAEPGAPLESAILDAIGHYDDQDAARLLLAALADGAVDRVKAFELLISRQSWALELLSQIESSAIAIDELPFPIRTRLLAHPSEDVRTRAAQCIPDESAPRREVIARYGAVLKEEGNQTAGKEVFAKHCLNCHQIGAVGHAVGPNLLTSKNRSAEILLTHILDPNREVQPAYAQHLIVDDEGRIQTGLLVAETPTSLTLKREGGAIVTVLKASIDEHQTTGKSLMPEGLEKSIDQRAMADLIAYLLGVQYDIGSEPGFVEPGP